jgi:signal transduction histidine kinase
MPTNQMDSSSQVVLWIDDDPEIIDFASRQIARRYPVRIENIPDFMLLMGLRESIGSTPIVFFLRMHRVPQPDELRQVFSRVPFIAIISDLRIGDDELGGIAILSAAALSPHHPQLILFSGDVTPSAEKIAKSLGVEHIISKRDGPDTILNILAEGFRFAPVRDMGTLQSLRLEVSEMRSHIRKLRLERSRLKKDLRNLLATKRAPQPPIKPAEKVSPPTLSSLQDRVTSLETERQVILAHQHDLVNTSSFTLQAIEQVCSNSRVIPPMIADDLERIRVSAKHCDVLVQSLTSLSAKLVPKKSSPSSVERAINEARQILLRKTPDNISVEVTQPKQVPLCAIPESLVVRCILNLWLNSIEAMPRGGHLAVKVIKPNGKARKIIVQVTDTGRGIARADVPRVFKPDFSTKGKKLGLGLFIVKKIMSDFGGRVDIRSNRGKGTQVTLRIPQA